MPPSSNSSSQPPDAGLKVAPEATAPPHASKRWVVWLVLGGVAMAIGAVYLLANRTPQQGTPAAVASVPTVVVSLGTLDRTIMVAGETHARNFAAIKVPVQRGRGGGSSLTLIHMAEGGAEVKKGDVVAEIDPERLRQQIDDYEDTISQSEANLRTQKAQQAVDWENLQQTVRSAKASLDRATHDFRAAEVKTDIERELLKLSLDEAQATYKQQLEALPLKDISLSADTRTQEISYSQQLKQRARLQTDLKNYTFLAPMDGMVVVQSFNRQGSRDMTQYQVGDDVRPGSVFLRVVDTSSMQVEGQANQAETSELRAGQPATVTLDAFPGVKFPGRVYSLGAMAAQGWRDNYYVRTVPVTVQIEGRDPRVIPDLSAVAQVRVARKENVLMAPLQTIHVEGDKNFVYVRGPEGFEKREVQIGLESATHAEIVSGLKAGDRVALSIPAIGK
jgi:multidrug efflux pump subunit AcrA (membrane-fusion protein)